MTRSGSVVHHQLAHHQQVAITRQILVDSGDRGRRREHGVSALEQDGSAHVPDRGHAWLSPVHAEQGDEAASELVARLAPMGHSGWSHQEATMPGGRWQTMRRAPLNAALLPRRRRNLSGLLRIRVLSVSAGNSQTPGLVRRR